MRLSFCLVCFVCLLIAQPVLAQTNPFLKRSSPAPQLQRQSEAAESSEHPDRLRAFKSRFQTMQYQLNQQLAVRTQAARDEQPPWIWLSLMLIAFAYGAFHTLGPGHGKCVVCSYFIAEDSHWRKGLLLGYLVAIVHALSAFGVVAVIYYLLKSSSQLLFDQATRLTSLVGYGLIAVLGAFLLLRQLRRWHSMPVAASGSGPANAAAHHHCEFHDCQHTHGHEAAPAQPRRDNIWLMALGIGVVPCPGALTILMFSISLDFLQLGIVLALMIALGMGLTTSLLAVLTILSRQGTLRWLSPPSHQQQNSRVEHALRLSGASLTLFFGLLFFWAAL
ncbi:MAG: hypothetical protein IGS03_09000 [Candidatus Sericytochromatia bacterium]|nr:hypothetical protein [Candidatus Sericytochromatia bacterium]